MTDDQHPTPVVREERPKPRGEVPVPIQWQWTERTVWTPRMCKALDTGVKGGKWFSLMDKVYSPKNLQASATKVLKRRGAAGIDHVTTKMYGTNLDDRLTHLSERLRQQKYRPQSVRRKWIAKAGSAEKRPLGIPTVQDRIVQTALVHTIEPIFEATFAEHSYGFRPGRGCKDALRRVDALLKEGRTYVVDVDLRSYFDTIPKDLLMQKVQERVADGKVLELIASFLDQQIMEDMQSWKPQAGTPQGAVLSPLLGNVYLNDLDHQMADAGFEMVRYADDFVILCRNAQEAAEALSRVKQWVKEAGLTLHPTKTRIACATTEGFEFLGYLFLNGRRLVRDKSLRRFKDAIRAQTRRTQGQSLERIITKVNRTIRGWYAYFQHARRWIFRILDSWIRMRLRSILRRRCGLRGRGRGADHQRWPNAYFGERGLLIMTEAHARTLASARAANP